jgi:hypothetical protein
MRMAIAMYPLIENAIRGDRKRSVPEHLRAMGRLFARFAAVAAGVFDIYSCFPSAVEIACEEIGLSEDDSRGLTVTSGLPYFGRPGNSYVLHSISEMIRQVRRRRGEFGLVTANGNYVTKHSWGIYSDRARRASTGTMYGKHGPEIGIIVGREDETGRRFLSNVSGDPAALIDLQKKEGLIDPEWSHQTAITTSVHRCEPRTPEMR